MSNTKRDGTPEETKAALISQHARWNAQNPNYQHDLEFWEQKQAEAEGEGYKTEVCSCGMTFLAFHHWVRCEKDGCPLRGEKSMLDIMMGDDSE